MIKCFVIASTAHQLLYMKLEGHILLQFLCWTLYPACLCSFASTFSHNVCPFSTGLSKRNYNKPFLNTASFTSPIKLPSGILFDLLVMSLRTKIKMTSGSSECIFTMIWSKSFKASCDPSKNGIPCAEMSVYVYVVEAWQKCSVSVLFRLYLHNLARKKYYTTFFSRGKQQNERLKKRLYIIRLHKLKIQQCITFSLSDYTLSRT